MHVLLYSDSEQYSSVLLLTAAWFAVQDGVWTSQATIKSGVGKGAHTLLLMCAALVHCHLQQTACFHVGTSSTACLSQGNGETKKREEKRRKNCTPTDTLFVVNFDPDTTREQDLAKHFSTYGKLKRVQVKRNYGFVQYELLDDATAARNGLSLSRLQGMLLALCNCYLAYCHEQ